MQLFTPLHVFLRLLHDLHETSTERFVNLAVVHDFLSFVIAIAIVIALPKFDWAAQGAISYCSGATPGNLASIKVAGFIIVLDAFIQ